MVKIELSRHYAVVMILIDHRDVMYIAKTRDLLGEVGSLLVTYLQRQ